MRSLVLNLAVAVVFVSASGVSVRAETIHSDVAIKNAKLAVQLFERLIVPGKPNSVEVGGLACTLIRGIAEYTYRCKLERGKWNALQGMYVSSGIEAEQLYKALRVVPVKTTRGKGKTSVSIKQVRINDSNFLQCTHTEGPSVKGGSQDSCQVNNSDKINVQRIAEQLKRIDEFDGCIPCALGTAI